MDNETRDSSITMTVTGLLLIHTALCLSAMSFSTGDGRGFTGHYILNMLSLVMFVGGGLLVKYA